MIPYLQVVKGSRELLLKFWDPLFISGTVEAIETSNLAHRLTRSGSYENKNNNLVKGGRKVAT